MNSNKEQMNESTSINQQSEQPMFSFGASINPQFEQPVFSFESASINQQVDGCFGFSAGGFPPYQQSSGFSFSGFPMNQQSSGFNFSSGGPTTTVSGPTTTVSGHPIAVSGSWDQPNSSKLSYFEKLCNKKKIDNRSLRCAHHPNNKSIIIDGYTLDYCNDSHTTICKETTIYSLVGQLHNICDKYDDLVEKHDDDKQKLLIIISKYKQKLSDLNRKINENKSETKKDIEEAEPINKKTKL